MAVKYGTSGNDTIQGTIADDILYGWAKGDDETSPSGNDKIFGKNGNDELYGGRGNDDLSGGAGNDTLDGGTGRDTMRGGSGNDTYLIGDNNDKIIEYINQGIDTVSVTASFVPEFSYRLGEHVENLHGGAYIDKFEGFGNALDNEIIGGYSSNNYLYGGAGNDTIVGGYKSGNFLYGGDGNDTLLTASPQSLNYMNGGKGNDTLTGSENGYGDTLIGGAGNDKITGLYGADIMTGGAGADRFIYNNPDEANGTDPVTDKPAVDRITDFSVADDTIVVSAAGFGGGLKAGAAITSKQFTLGVAATDKSDRFIYNSSDGALLFDVDGSGSTAATQLASLPTGLAMTNNDIFVIA